MNNGMMPGPNNMEQTMYMATPNNTNVPLPIIMCPKIYCLVEFKRGRTLQYESANYVAPGMPNSTLRPAAAFCCPFFLLVWVRDMWGGGGVRNFPAVFAICP